MPVLTSILSQFPLFEGLPQPLLLDLAQHAQTKVVNKREILINKGDTKEQLYLLLEGRLQGIDFTQDGKEVGIYFVEPGDYIGEMTLIDKQPHSEFLTALSRSMIILLPGEVVKSVIFSNPSAMESLCRKLARRLRESNAHKVILAQPNPLQRLCMHLLLLKQTIHEGNLYITNAPTHQELAIMLNASRETVTRSFQLLQSKNIIERDGTFLYILNMHELNNIASGKSKSLL